MGCEKLPDAQYQLEESEVTSSGDKIRIRGAIHLRFAYHNEEYLNNLCLRDFARGNKFHIIKQLLVHPLQKFES